MPLETPTIPISDERRQMVSEHADYILSDTERTDQHFAFFETDLAQRPDDNSTIDINEPDQVFNADRLMEHEAELTEIPETARPSITRAEILKTRINFLADKQCNADIRNTTRTLVTMRRLA